MTGDRYQELRVSGPEISAEDWARLREFSLCLKSLDVSVYAALLDLGASERPRVIGER